MTEEERSERFLLPLFDGTNFTAWKFRMRILLEEHDLLQCIETEAAAIDELKEEPTDNEAVKKVKTEKREKRLKQDRRCKSLLVSRIHDSQLEYVQEKGTPKQIWDALVRVFERKSIASRMHLKRQLLSLRYESGSLQEHFLRFDRLTREYRNTGAVMEELDVICHLLVTLGPKFATVVTAIETMPEDKLSLEFVRCRLLDEETKQKGSGAELFTSTDSTAFAGSHKKSRKKKKLKCFGCQQEGHKLSECPKKTAEKGKFSKANLADRGGISFVALNSECRDNVKISGQRRVKWFVDSGCSDHLVKDRELFEELKPLTKPVHIAVAKNDESIVATHSGTVRLFCVVGGSYVPCTINDVLFVPSLRFNLFSVVKVESKGMRVVFSNGQVKICRGSETLVCGTRNGKLYELDMYTSEHCASEAMLSCGRISKNLLLWHRRLGHLNANQLGQLVNKRLVDGLETKCADRSEIVCEPCVLGKQSRKPFPARDGKRSSRVLEVIHSDVCGPITPTGPNGERYFISFVDDWSHFAMVFPMKSKSEAYACFEHYEAVVTAKFGQQISRLKCDNGGEYANKNFLDFCRGRGIQVDFTVPYSPQQNGTSERLNRTVVERARAMLEDARISKKFWVQAVQTAVYLINRCPTNANDLCVTPFEIWEGKRPNVSKLRTFGCTAYVHIPKETRRKLEVKAWKGVFVGYSPSGYRVWNPKKRVIVVAHDVDFVELPEMLPQSVPQEVKNYNPVICVRKEECESQSNNQQSGSVETVDDEVQSDAVEEEDEEQFASFREEEATTSEESAETSTASGRPVRVRSAPRWHRDYEVDANFALNALSYVENLPDSLTEMQKREDWCLWQKAMQEEMNALQKNGTWTLAELPAGRNAISCKWIFKLKPSENDQPPRYKARLVARGFSQKPGFDFSETYSPVARMDTLRSVLALANQEGMAVHQMDVKTAFLNGDLSEEIFMIQPEGFRQEKGLVCRLHKSLYGLKQASRSWNIRFNGFIERLGFTRSSNDLCLYYRGSGKQQVIIVLYVDDILIVSPSEKLVCTIKQCLAREFEMSDQGAVKHFLGMKIDRDLKNKVLCISQQRYLESLLIRFEMQNCRPVSTPIENKLKLPKGEESKRISKPYRELVGCLMYVALTSRPDLAVAANFFSQFQVCPNEEHWVHLRRVLRYVKGTLSFGLCYRGKENSPLLEVYTDADWANETTDRRSISGAVFKVCGASVSWFSKKQTTVSLSSTEAELVALCAAACHSQWILRLLADLGRIPEGPVQFHEDNQSVIKIASNPKDSSRLKHMEVKHFYVRELLERNLIKLDYVPSTMQQADILTKGLPAPGFKKLRGSLGMIDCNV